MTERCQLLQPAQGDADAVDAPLLVGRLNLHSTGDRLTELDRTLIDQAIELRMRAEICAGALLSEMAERGELHPGQQGGQLTYSRAFHATVDSHHCLSRVREPPFCRSQNPIYGPP